MDAPLDLDALRRKLADSRGPAYWRSLEELAEDPGFEELLHREFPRQASEWDSRMDRRRFLGLMAASLALAGLSACARQPSGKLLPYVRQPEGLVPGEPQFFTTAMTLGGFARGVVAETHEGRPTKLDGNPDHPASLGGSDAFLQASVLGLYDPDRSQAVLRNSRPDTLASCLAEVRKALWADGEVRILTETITSSALSNAIYDLMAKAPAVAWHRWEPLNRDHVDVGSRAAFGEAWEAMHAFDQAAVVVSLGGDFLWGQPASLADARTFAKARRGVDGQRVRLYVAETTPSLAGAMADLRVAATPDGIDGLARELAALLGVVPAAEGASAWARAAAADLRAHRGRSLVVVGPEQPPHVHALGHALNHALGNAGKTVKYVPSVAQDFFAKQPVTQARSLAELVADMHAGKVDTLLVLGGNPVYQAPGDLDFAGALAKVKTTLHLGGYVDETAKRCGWHVPEAHYLETWGDAWSFDVTQSLQQPMIEPLYDGISALQLVTALRLGTLRDAQQDLRDGLALVIKPGEFEEIWENGLSTGKLMGTGPEPRDPKAPKLPALPPLPKPEGLAVVFRPSPTVWDGRFANNGWLQELPEPLTKLCWGNAALLSPQTASRLGVANGDELALRLHGRTVKGPAWIMPGHADDAVTLTLGYGRTAAGRAGDGVGFDVNPIRRAEAPWLDRGLAVSKTGARVALTSTQAHQAMEGRDLVKVVSVEELHRDPLGLKRQREADPPSLLGPRPGNEHAWGMSIDLNACIGCNACMVACQAENNIPVVGAEQVQAGRQMHWLRVDRYYAGDPATPETYFQPVPCMHCEKAPCEEVCPVAATVHSAEGLNDMVYNRCVGTRYCSNNCPYKVRRFNFFQYSDVTTESLKAQRNPEVTVRQRGVMEKCTYCVQRIARARVRADGDDRPIQDGEVVTACQSACPTNAIVFGDQADPTTAVAKQKSDPLAFGLLEDLGTRPRTTYLARVTNPPAAPAAHPLEPA